MNMKRTFGAILTILGIVGIIWGAYAFMMGGDGGVVGKYTSVVPFIVGLIFFFSGINLVKTTKDAT
jgi:predicted Na+-dependent transporter